MLLKGFSEMDGYTNPIYFTLSDAPVLVSDTLVALTSRCMSYLVKYDTISRGEESHGIYEGDEVYRDDELIGHVLYSKGFFLQELNKAVKKLPVDQHIQVREGNASTIRNVRENPERTELLFGYKGNKITINSLLGMQRGFILLNGYNHLVKPEEISFFTGITTDEGRHIFYGDTFKGGTVVLNNFIPSVRLSSDTYSEL